MRTLTVIAVLLSAPIWARGRTLPHCVSKGGSCGTQQCCPGLVCDFNRCVERDSLSDDEIARKKAQDERRDEPGPKK